MSRVTLCVAESESGPGALSSDRLSVHGPTLLVTSVAAASSRLGFCPVHPRSAQTCPVPLRRALTAAESVSSSARWGRGARDPWSLPAPLFPGPLDLAVLETHTWRWQLAPSPLSTLSACFLLAAGSCLLAISSLITQTLLPYKLCLVGTMFLSHNLSFLSQLPGVQLSSDSCQKHKLPPGAPTSEVSQTPLFVHILDFPLLQSPAQQPECSCLI